MSIKTLSEIWDTMGGWRTLAIYLLGEKLVEGLPPLPKPLAFLLFSVVGAVVLFSVLFATPLAAFRDLRRRREVRLAGPSRSVSAKSPLLTWRAGVLTG